MYWRIVVRDHTTDGSCVLTMEYHPEESQYTIVRRAKILSGIKDKCDTIRIASGEYEVRPRNTSIVMSISRRELLRPVFVTSER